MATVSNTATSVSHSLGPKSKAVARAGIAAAALLGVAVFIPSSLANWLAVDRPFLATKIAPWSAEAAANAAAALKNPQDPKGRALVHRALARDLTNVPAIELRALDLAVSGKTPEARALFDLSNKLSRRSLPTRLWLIQDAVDHGSVAGALKNFDIALRTSSDAQPILFPVLAKASADETLTVQLARVLDQPSDWRQMFFEWVFAANTDVRPTARVAYRMHDTNFLTANRNSQRLIERLVIAREFSQARFLQSKLHPISQAVADSNFQDPSAQYPFGWGLVSNGSIGAERSVSGSTTTLSYRAAPANSGQVAAQLLTLAPGPYLLASRTGGTGAGTAPNWSVTCGEEGGAELVRLDQPLIAARRAEAAFTVPAGCSGQWLTLTIRPAPDASPQSGSIAWIAVTRG